MNVLSKNVYMITQLQIFIHNFYAKAIPARTTMARALMPRQPYSVAVLSTGGRLHPLVPEGFCPPELGEPKGA